MFDMIYIVLCYEHLWTINRISYVSLEHAEDTVTLSAPVLRIERSTARAALLQVHAGTPIAGF
jgi:hypothetical protein